MNNETTEILPFEIHPSYAYEIRKGLPDWSGNPEELLLFSRLEFQTPSRTELAIGILKDGEESGDARQIMTLQIPSLRELFRGNIDPGEFGDYPRDDYQPFFFFLESGISEDYRLHNKVYSDDDFIEIYSALRRRPDGKTIGYMHDLLWRNCAFFLLTRRCSQREYEACVKRLETSARMFHFDRMSCNYFTHITSLF